MKICHEIFIELIYLEVKKVQLNKLI